MKYSFIYYLLLFISIVGITTAVLFIYEDSERIKTTHVINSNIDINYCNMIYNSLGVDKNYNFTHDDFEYSPHYVKFHIYPEKEGINVSIKIDDECFKNIQSMIGHTDNNSDVVFPMISNAKYNILIDDNRCSYYIYPSESNYNIKC